MTVSWIALSNRLAIEACLLDAGCGPGGLLQQIGERLPWLERIGLEYDFQAAEIAAAKSGAIVLSGTINAMPFPNAKFDVIVSADVLCHQQADEEAALAKLPDRRLKTGGSLFLNLPAYAFMKSMHDQRVHNLRRYTRNGNTLVSGEIWISCCSALAIGTACCFRLCCFTG